MLTTLHNEIKEALQEQFGCVPSGIERMKGGANNICLMVDSGNRRLLAKKYFVHERDKRDRLNAEFSMLSFLWSNGVRCIPEPLALDRVRRIGFYSFVEGCMPEPDGIGPADVELLCGLLCDMWRLRSQPGADSLPAGSDAAFRLQDYIDCVLSRLDVVVRCAASSRALPAFREFAMKRLSPVFRDLMEDVRKNLARHGLDPAATLAMRERTLNPADHGFHNAIRRRDGSLVFIDFEYAGWDDPAQMICNACLQPEIPIPARLVNGFLRRIMACLGGDESLARRLRIAYPLLAFKWCLIMLNEFLPVSDERRMFAGLDIEERRLVQLEKAARQIEKVEAFLAGGDLAPDMNAPA